MHFHEYVNLSILSALVRSFKHSIMLMLYWMIFVMTMQFAAGQLKLWLALLNEHYIFCENDRLPRGFTSLDRNPKAVEFSPIDSNFDNSDRSSNQSIGLIR